MLGARDRPVIVTSGTFRRAIEPQNAAARLFDVRTQDALFALDAATRAIAGELDLDRVLQLMVDSVRDLVGSRYAALGIIAPGGRIERFITSGVTPEERARIGNPPSGHGLLGTIIRDGVSLRIPEIAGHPDTYGFPPNHPPMHSFLGVPVRVGGRPVGNFYLTEKVGRKEFTSQDQQLVEMFALHASIAIQNARLHQQVQQLAIVDERLRISRDLHDGIIQSIYAVSLTLEDVPELLSDDPDEAAVMVDRAIERLHTTIRDIRAFITGLGTGTDVSLADALRSVVAELAPDPAIQLDVELEDAADIDQRLSPDRAHEVLQVAREALSNTFRHSRASRARLGLESRDGELVLAIEDNGRGFDPAERPAPGHLGLANLRDRATAAGGLLDISAEPGRGTRIIFRVPLFDVDLPPS
jgi:signal transduction histidine kinase